VTLNRFGGVMGTTRKKTAMMAQQRTDEVPVTANNADQDFLHRPSFFQCISNAARNSLLFF
jgi:hypothetical protein